MIKRIDLFMPPPKSQYGVLPHFTRKFAEALTRVGVNCRILEAEKDNPKPFLKALFQDPPDCTLSFNGLLPDAEGHFFCDMIKIPHVACLVDSPNQFLQLAKSPRTIITCPDRFSCEFFQGLNCKNVIFMPHGVERELAPPLEAKKSHDVVMLSSFIDYEEMRRQWPSKFPKVLCDTLDIAAEIALEDEDTPYVQAFVQALDRQVAKHAVNIEQLPVMEALDELEHYIRGKDRVGLLKAIRDARVDVYGSSVHAMTWDKYFGKHYPNITFHPGVPYEEALNIMKESKIVLNSCAWIKNGGHERIFSGLCCGALVVTNKNVFMREHFTDGRDIAFYRYGHWDEVNNKVNAYLADPLLLEQVVERGRENVLRGHTWDHRAKVLVNELSTILETIPQT